MYDKFSSQTKGIVVRSHKYALKYNEYSVGTEYLLLSLFNEPNSSCHILLKELKIEEQNIIDSINKIDVFRKNIPGLVIYTPKFRLILEKSIDIANETDSDLVYEEHLFYSLLHTPDCIAYKILEMLEIDINELISEIIDVMGWNVKRDMKSKEYLENFSFVENMTLLVKKNKLLPLIGREVIINRITNILNKRNKRNAILIGNAGVGKSAIVEGLAQKYYKEKVNKQIISLNITSLLAGTKYRGDFEQRIKDFLSSVKNRDDIIVFIDEIHNIINVGNGDSNLDVANILKPSLARGEIVCIGATTIDEYYRHIANDAALSRRFLPIFVDEPTLDETINILSNIKDYYENFHHITIPTPIISYLCERVEKSIINRYFPDKAIDVLDEACAYTKIHNLKELNFVIIDHIIQTINSQEANELSKQKLNNYHFLKKYYLRYYSNIKTSFQPIVSILCKYQNEEQLNILVNDISLIFNIRSEAVKKINLNNFHDEHSIANLIGSPPGYVGFDNPNTLTKFVQKYPRSIILLQNLDQCALNITQLIKDILNSGYIEDLANNKIYFSNTIIIATENSQNKTIGFLNLEIENQYKGEVKFNEIIKLNHFIDKDIRIKKQENLLNKYIFYFKNNDIDVKFEDYDYIVNNIEEKKYHELENLLYECLFNDNKKTIVIDYNLEKESFFIKK